MYAKHHRISKAVYDYCCKKKMVDTALVAKWKKPGYERLCCTHAINPANHAHGTVSICRVPKEDLSEDRVIVDVTCGCLGCASGSGGFKNIFGNKFGQSLADIQVARETASAGVEAAAAAPTADDRPEPDTAHASVGAVPEIPELPSAAATTAAPDSKVWATEAELAAAESDDEGHVHAPDAAAIKAAAFGPKSNAGPGQKRKRS